MQASIGVLTSGGDCPGLNAVIRAVCKSAAHLGWKTLGIKNGFEGLYDIDYVELNYNEMDGLLARGGTILGSTNKGHFAAKCGNQNLLTIDPAVVARTKENFQALGLSALVVLGGDGSLSIAQQLYEAGIPVVGVPKTIDNDAPGTDMAIGFATARSVVTDALDKLDTTASSHHRVMIAETMGRGAGHLALESAIAGFADVALIPEIPYRYEKVVERLKLAFAEGRKHALVVIAEGIKKPDGEYSFSSNGRTFGGISAYFVERLSKDGFNVRANVLGHIQRAGTPIAEDRILASGLAVHAIELLAEGKSNRVVIHKDGHFTDEDLDVVLHLANRPVDTNGEMVKIAQSLGIYIGEK